MGQDNHGVTTARHIAARCAMAGSLGLLAAGGWGSAVAAPQVPTPTALMDWAQSTYPSFFPGTLPDQQVPWLVYRGPYANGMFIGVMDDTVHVLGPLTNNADTPVGSLASFSCAVYPAGCQTVDAATFQAVQDFLARFDALYANGVPATLADIRSLIDGCSLASGDTLASITAEFNADPQNFRDGLKYRIGSQRTNLRVLADRNSTNADGSSRRELDVLFDVVYADGTVGKDSAQTLIYGSSAGTLLGHSACTTSENKAEWRFFGDRKLVDTAVRAVNALNLRTLLATGVAHANPVTHTRQLQFMVRDPSGFATYATISGPGIVGGTYKLVSPRLLKAAPEFAGKVGHFMDWPDNESFRACRISASSNNYAAAELADCTQFGASAYTWGSTNADPVAVDRSFDNSGFVAGGQYTVKIYNDDGWKTVNGQAGKTPLATYTTTLEGLPFPAVSLAANGNQGYAAVTSDTSATATAALFRSKSAGSLHFSVAHPPTLPGNSRFGFGNSWVFEQGRTAASTASNFYPASRLIWYTYPDLGATTLNMVIPAAPVAMTTPTYAETVFQYSNRNNHFVRTVLTYE